MRRIALVGTSDTACEAPFTDKSWEIWGVAARTEVVTRADRWFELHRLEGEGEEWRKRWREEIKNFSKDIELWMFYPEPDLAPIVKSYPYEHIVSRFGTYFNTSSFAWMMALAIDEMRPLPGMSKWHERIGLDEIGIWGVEMEFGTEYREQRDGFRHYIDVAQGLGIQVTRLVKGGLAYDPVPYPFWQDDPLLAKLAKRTATTAAELEGFDRSLRQTRSLIAQNKAVLEEIVISKKKGYRRAARIEAVEKENARLIETSAQLSHQIVEATAREQEQKWLKDYLSP